MSNRYVYPVGIEDAPDGTTIQFPDLPEAITGAATRAEALALAADCLEEALAGRIVRKEDIPRPSPARGRPTVGPGAVIAAKAALYEALREAGIPNTALGKRLGVPESEVRRMLNPRHATKIGRLEAALAALGKRLVVEIRDAA
jgi:antitoxin HicB